MPHQMIKFRLDNYIFDLRRQAHLEGKRYGWLDWTFMQWEWFGGIILLIGSILLIIGSILFLPECGPMLNQVGSYVFVGSSFCYMTTSGHDFLEVVAASMWSKTSNAAANINNLDSSTSTTINNNNNNTEPSSSTSNLTANNNTINWMEWFSAITFLCGASLFMLGTASALLTPMMMDSMDPFLPTAWSFIIGSCCCLSGSVVNTMQIWDAPDRKSAQYANMIAVHYIIGSSFYLCGSIPYLYFYHHVEDKRNITRCVALFFIIGSIVFLVGSIINLYRIKWNEKYDPELNWWLNQNPQQYNHHTAADSFSNNNNNNNKKPKRISSDIEDPLFLNNNNNKKNDEGTIRKGRKSVDRRPSGTTRTTTMSVASSSGRDLLSIHNGNASSEDSSVDFGASNNEKRSSLDYSSRRRRISSNINNNNTSQEILPAFDQQGDVSSGLWT